MRNSLLAGISALTLLSSASLASDLPSKPNNAAISTSRPSFSWDGIYFGGNFGKSQAKGVGNASNCESIQNIEFFDLDGGDYCSQEQKFIGDYYSWSKPDQIFWHNGGNYLYDESINWSGYPNSGRLDRNNATGSVVGGQIGFNREYGAFVVGAEINVAHFFNEVAESWQGFTDRSNGGGGLLSNGGSFEVSSISSLKWLSTVQGRLGFALRDDRKLLPYAVAGVALAFVNAETSPIGGADGSNASLSNANGNRNFMQSGWTVGGGLEYALTNNWSIAAEYVFVKLYGQQEHSVHFSAQNADTGFDIVHKVGFDEVRNATVKLNYHF